MTLVELSQIHKTYWPGNGAMEVPALRGINLIIEKGDYIAIMGRSGSGKSTLLNIMGCLDRPTKGRYLLNAQDVSSLEDDRLSEIRGRYVGFVFQSYNLIPLLSVQENITIPMYYQGHSEVRSRKRAEELAARVGIKERIHHKSVELSGGQQQRVAIARALANEPLLILADEPTGNLDSSTSEEILAILDELNRSGTTLVLVTHDEEVAGRAKRIIRMRDGLIGSDRLNLK
jgi:putative ABC transport system ATP-binding protein